MSVQTNFKENILNRRKQSYRNIFSYYLSHSETLLYSFLNKRLLSHMNTLIMSLIVFCINLDPLKPLFGQKIRQLSVNGED